jgi:hypothetical protein
MSTTFVKYPNNSEYIGGIHRSDCNLLQNDLHIHGANAKWDTREYSTAEAALVDVIDEDLAECGYTREDVHIFGCNEEGTD